MKRLALLGLMAVGVASGLLPTAHANDAPDVPSGAAASTNAATDEPRSQRVRTGESLYDWNWLAARCDKDNDGIVTQDEIGSLAEIFKRLDCNWDGRLTSDDFDWSDEAALGWQKATTFALFKVIDASSEGRITAEEWQAAFEKATGEKGYLNDHDLDELIFLPRVVKSQKEAQRGRQRGEFAGGKRLTEAPQPGQLAPDFELHTPDGKSSIRLSSFREQKPVVLIFGSFT
jgi:hypothetical protein